MNERSKDNVSGERPVAFKPSDHHRDAEYLWLVEEYKRRIAELFPEIPHRLLDNCSIFSVDALLVGYFLEGLEREVAVYEIGSFVGVSSYVFATHPNVSSLTCIDPNPAISDEALANSSWAESLDLEALKDVKVFDVLRKTFASLDKKALQKVEFKEGVVGSENLGARTEKTWQAEKVRISEVGEAGQGMISYVDGLHTKEGVRKDLEAVFENNPRTIAILDDCRHAWGAFVQAGVVEFLEHRQKGEYTFRLLADLGPGTATSNLGLLYHEGSEEIVRSALRHASSKFSRKLDPIQLLIRESDLIEEVNSRIEEVNRLARRVRELGKENEFLRRTLRRRSHQAAEALASSFTKIPLARNLIRKG